MIYVTEQSTQINSEVNLNPLSNTNTKGPTVDLKLYHL